MKSLREVGAYWRATYPERDFERIRPLLRLSRLAFLVPAFQKSALAPHDLSPSEYSILGALRRAGRPRQLQPGDLYNAVGCTPGGLTKMIDRLEKRGLVQRMTDRQDGRRARIRLTAKGATIERRAFEGYNDSAERILAPLSDDEIQRINDALDLLSALFEAPGATAPASDDATNSLAAVRAALQDSRSNHEREDRMEAE